MVHLMGEQELHFNASQLLGIQLMAQIWRFEHERIANWLGTQFDPNETNPNWILSSKSPLIVNLMGVS